MRRLIILCLAIMASAATVAGQVNLSLDHQIEVQTKGITAVAFSHDSRLAAIGTAEGWVYVREVLSGEQRYLLKTHTKKINSLTFSGDDKYLVAGADDKKISIWSLDSGALAQLFEEKAGQPNSLAISDDGRLLVVGTEKQISLREFPSGVVIGSLKGHERQIINIAFGAAANELVSVGEDKRIIWWDLDKKKSLRTTEIDVHTLPNSGNDVKSAAMSADKRFIAVGLDEQVLEKGGQGMKFKYTLAFYDWRDGAMVKTLDDNYKTIDHIELTSQNCYVMIEASTLQTRKLAFRNIASGEFEYETELGGEILAYAVAPGGDKAAAAIKAESKCMLMLWNLTIEKPSTGCFMSKFAITSESEPLISFGGPYVIAVLPFEVAKIPLELEQSVPKMLETKLVASPKVRLVERGRIDDVLKELNFQQSDYVGERAAEIGKILGAEYLITGNVSMLGHDLILSVKLVSTETSEIVGIREIHCEGCSLEDIFEAVNLIAPTVAE
ncbi:MAG: CsgG/HfaB family protein [Candidatus Zixiibacteriota bacterium]